MDSFARSNEVIWLLLLRLFQGGLRHVKFFELFRLVGQLNAARSSVWLSGWAETDTANFKGNTAKAHDISLTKLDCAQRGKLDYFPQKVVDLVDVRFLVRVSRVINVIVLFVVH